MFCIAARSMPMEAFVNRNQSRKRRDSSHTESRCRFTMFGFGVGCVRRPPHPPLRLTRSASVYGDLSPSRRGSGNPWGVPRFPTERGEVWVLPIPCRFANLQPQHLSPPCGGEVAAAERFASRKAAGEGSSTHSNPSTRSGIIPVAKIPALIEIKTVADASGSDETVTGRPVFCRPTRARRSEESPLANQYRWARCVSSWPLRLPLSPLPSCRALLPPGQARFRPPLPDARCPPCSRFPSRSADCGSLHEAP